MVAEIKVAPFDEYNEVLVKNAHPANWQNPTPDGRYNLLVIGGGSAGLVAAVGAKGLGAKVALVEKHLLGGDCLNAGCVPSKTVIRSAKAIGDIHRATELGVSVPAGVTADFGAVMARMRRPLLDESIYVCGEAYSNAQGWIEGALQTAEHVLEQEFKLARPDWLPRAYSLGP